MSKQQKHIIKEQIIEIEVEEDDDLDLNELRQRVIKLYKKEIGEQLDKIFSRLAPPDVHVRLDSFEIDLGEISLKTMEMEVKAQVRRSVEKALKKEFERQGVKTEYEEGKPLKANVSKAAILEHFLRTGNYPPWATTERSIQEIFRQLMAKNPKEVVRMIMEMKNNSHLQTRLIFQFSNKDLYKLLSLLFKKNSKKALSQIELIKKRVGRRYKALRGQRSVEKAILEGALAYFFDQTKKGKHSKFDGKIFTAGIVEEIQSRYQHVTADDLDFEPASRVRNEFSGRHSELEIIEYFLKFGSIPAWAEVSSSDNFQSLLDKLLKGSLVGLQRLVEKNAGDEQFIQRLVYQFSMEQILQLFEPTPGDNLEFIKSTIEELNLLTEQRKNIPSALSATQLRVAVLKSAVLYFFRLRRSNFVRQTFVQLVLESIAPIANSSYDDLVRETFRSINRKKQNTEIQATLEVLESKLSKEAEKKKEQTEKLNKQSKELQSKLEEIEKKLKKGNLTDKEVADLKKEQSLFQRDLGKVQRSLGEDEKSEVDEILKERDATEKRLEAVEKRLRQQQTLKERQVRQLEKSRNEIKKELSDISKRFERLQLSVIRDIERLLGDRKTLEEGLEGINSQLRTETDQDKRKSLERNQNSTTRKLERNEQRLRFKAHDLKSAIGKMQGDQKRLELLLLEIKGNLRANITPQERKILQQQQEKLSKELEKLKPRLSQLEKTQKDLQKQLRKPSQAEDTAPIEKAEQSKTSKLDFLLSLLQFGSIPWWAQEFKDSSIEQILIEFAKDSPSKLRQAFSRVEKNPIVWQRLVNQLPENSLEKVLEILYPGQAGFIITMAMALERVHQSQVFKSASNRPIQHFKWDKIIEFVMVNPISSINSFVKRVVAKIAGDYHIAPSELLKALQNIGKNIKGRFSVFEHIIPSVAEEKELIDLEKDMLRGTSGELPVSKEMDIELTNEQKMTLLTKYFQTGKVVEEGKGHGLDNHRDYELLFLHQLESNKLAMAAFLKGMLVNRKTREIIAQQFRDSTFWEVIQFLHPKGLITSINYLGDFKNALGDDLLHLEKGALLDYSIQTKPDKFAIKDYVKFVLSQLVRQTRRDPIAIINEWKRKTLLKADKMRSTLIISVMALEVDYLQAQQQSTQDIAANQNLQKRIEALSKDTNLQSQKMVYILTRESLENQGIPSQSISVDDIFRGLEELHKEIGRIDEELAKLAPDQQILQRSEMRRDRARLEAQIAVLQRKQPSIVRYLNPLIEEAEKAIERLLEKSVAAIPPPIESKVDAEFSETKEELQKIWKILDKTELDLSNLLAIEKQAQKVNAKGVLAEIRTLRKQLEKDQISEDVFQQQWTETIGRITALIQPEEQVQNWIKTIQKQLDFILKNIKKANISELFEQWSKAQEAQDHLVSFTSKSGLGDNEDLADQLLQLDELQSTIYRRIQQQQRSRSLFKIRDLKTTQRAFRKEIEESRSIAGLEQLLDKLEESEKQQLSEIDKTISDVVDDALKLELTKLKENIQETFRQLRQAYQEKQLAELRKQREEAIQQTRETEDIESQLPTKEELSKKLAEKLAKKAAPVAKKIEDALIVRNAGLVLLHPFISRLFSMLGYVDKKEFVSEDAQHKAVHILQYLATAQTSTPENELVLNKVLCNMAITDPVPLSMDFTEHELKTAAGLLGGAIANWSKMGSMSPDALRNTFIMREGTIKEQPDRWMMIVEKNTLDLLLKTLPWGYTFVKLPWMEKFLSVEWPSGM